MSIFLNHFCDSTKTFKVYYPNKMKIVNWKTKFFKSHSTIELQIRHLEKTFEGRYFVCHTTRSSSYYTRSNPRLHE